MLYLLTGLERKRCLAKTAPGHSPPRLLCESSRRGDRGGGEGRGRSVASSLIVLAHFGHVANYAIVGLVHGILVLQRLQVRQAATSRPRMSQITLVLDLKFSPAASARQTAPAPPPKRGRFTIVLFSRGRSLTLLAPPVLVVLIRIRGGEPGCQVRLRSHQSGGSGEPFQAQTFHHARVSHLDAKR